MSKEERVRLLHGDCLEVLKTLESDSVDALVTDPPAGIGFMGKDWDHHKGGREQWVAWMREVMTEALRVLKPGAHGLVWAIPRTSHWTGTALEDAGFDVRDRIAHVFGCLSEDTEILINGRWERYDKAMNKGYALCYIPEHDEYQWQPIQDYIEYEYDDTAFRIISDCTDQIVSRNHRCLVERGGEYVFRYAETLEREETIPVLEGLSELLCRLPLPHKGAGEPESVLQRGVCAEESRQGQAAIGTQGAGGCVCVVRQEGMEAGCFATESEDSVLQSFVSGESGDGSDIDRQQVRPHRHEVSRHGLEGREESFMEGWRDVLPKKGELQANQIRSVSSRVYADGTEGRLCDGASAFRGAGDGAVSASFGSSASQGSRPAQQQPEQSGIVFQQSRPQAVRTSRHTRPDLARVEPTHYKGKVWCVRVPSGAFVARRNGKVFITGNSGFPKSMDVSKQLDKIAGEERERYQRPAFGASFSDDNGTTYGTAVNNNPISNSAKQWQGWGTALKPAMEDWWLVRKPFPGTVAANVLKHGTGAINVDGCRVGASGGTCRDGKADQPNDAGWKNMRGHGITTLNSGRWPANFTHDGSAEVVGLFPETGVSSGGGGHKKHGIGSGNGIYGVYGQRDCPANVGLGDSGSAARFFYCAKASKADRDEGLEDFALRSASECCEDREPGSAGLNNPRAGAGRTSGARNIHPTVKPTSLMRYLCRLITPPNGIILDPFMGSGSTGKGAMLEGFRFIGIEREAEYLEIARARINHQLEKVLKEQEKQGPEQLNLID